MMLRDRRHAQLYAVRPERRRQALDVVHDLLRRHRQVQPFAMAPVPGEEGVPGTGINPARLQAEPTSRQSCSSTKTIHRIRIVPAGHERGGQSRLLRHSANADILTLCRHRQSGKLKIRRQLWFLATQGVFLVYMWRPRLSGWLNPLFRLSFLSVANPLTVLPLPFLTPDKCNCRAYGQRVRSSTKARSRPRPAT